MTPRDRPPSDEAGLVLAAAMWIAALVVIVAGSAARDAIAVTRATEAAVARERALHAAEAVLLATVERLERDADDWRSPAAADPSLLGHPWRGLGPALAGIPGAAVADEPEVRLGIERTGHGPTYRLEVEARVRDRVRALEAIVRPSSVADLAWATVHEVSDPDATGGDRVACAVHRWAVDLHEVTSRSPREPDGTGDAAACRRVRVDDGLTVRGPFHTDDALRSAAGWAATGPMSSAAPPDAATGRVPLAVVATDDASVVGGRDGLTHGPTLLLPSDPFGAIGGTSACILRGPTLLRLDGHRIRVRSPRSHPRYDAEGGPTVHCPGLDRDGLDGIVVLAPSAPEVLVVRRDPGARCAEHPLGIDPTEDDVREQRCGDGTAYVWGRYRGARTVVAEDDVQLVWDVEPGTAVAADGPGAGALLGLVAGGSVVIRRPVSPPVRLVAPFGVELPFAGPGIAPFGEWPIDAPTSAPVRWEAPRVVAVVAALRGSLRVQNPRWGRAAAEPIHVTGAVVQRFHGPTSWERRDATGALQAVTGARLVVHHDPRLDAAVPPALPRLHGGQLRILAVREVPPASIP